MGPICKGWVGCTLGAGADMDVEPTCQPIKKRKKERKKYEFSNLVWDK
jgi:hypothetical protein